MLPASLRRSQSTAIYPGNKVSLKFFVKMTVLLHLSDSFTGVFPLSDRYPNLARKTLQSQGRSPLTNHLASVIRNNIGVIKQDYNEASYLYSFWKNYPPEDRGRKPIKDQYPWIEVGEHAIGSKLPRILEQAFHVRDAGLPSGSDQRFVLKNEMISIATGGYTSSAWLFVDIKSIGPRDDQAHTVMSHNQISGDGLWIDCNSGVKNTILKATGSRRTHNFYASLPPLFVLSDGALAPLVVIALKPVYKMLAATAKGERNDGQPLNRIDIACIPNGLLLTQNPGYLKIHPGLLFPGKDEKGKDPRKLRARVSFEVLERIDSWRVQTIDVPFP